MTDHAELIERLRAEVMYDAFGDLIVPSLLDQAATALDALVAERDALREALKPFAALADVHMGESNDARRWPAVKVGWLRAARAALAQDSSS